MVTFYSIVYANIRPSISERVSIALIVRDQTQTLFHYAPKKLAVIRLLLPAEAFSLLKMSLTRLNEYVINPDLYKHGLPLGQTESLSPAQRLLSAGYISHLARLSNNLLSFSEPVPIDLPMTEAAYQKLFTKYVFSDWDELPVC